MLGGLAVDPSLATLTDVDDLLAAGGGDCLVYSSAAGEWGAQSCAGAAGGDDLGDHTADQNIIINTHWLSGDGGNEGIRIDDTGNVGVGVMPNPVYRFMVNGDANIGGNTNIAGALTISDTTGSNGDKALSVLQTENSGTNYGVHSSVIGPAMTNIAGYFSATNATNNYALIVENGNVGIGTTGPQARLHVEGGDFRIQNTTASLVLFGDGGRFTVSADNAANQLNVEDNGGISRLKLAGADATIGHVLAAGLHSSALPTYGSNACRSTLGQTKSGYYSIGDCASDARLKHDITYIPDGALAKILALKPATFVWNEDKDAAVRAGFIAQDTLPHIPEAVGVNEATGYYNWDSNAVLSYTVKALQELATANDALRAGNDELRRRIEALEAAE